jgi:LysM repeat protein
LAALFGILFLVVVVPVVLIAWVGWPLPAGMPTVSEVTDALRDTYIPDEFLLKALAVVCWVVWVELVASLLVEAVAYLRGRRAAQVPLAGGVQKAAARLVATVALLGTLTAARGLPSTSSPSPHGLSLASPPIATLVEARQVHVPAPDSGDRLAPIPAAPSAQPSPIYEVQRRDTLWGIAERHLGDPLRWQDVYRLNQGRPQPDGRALTDPDVIHPGWRLELPPDATGFDTPPPPPPAPSPDPQPASTAGGMVLIDEHAAHPTPETHDPVVLVSETHTPTTARSTPPPAPDGMVLLPDEEP